MGNNTKESLKYLDVGDLWTLLEAMRCQTWMKSSLQKIDDSSQSYTDSRWTVVTEINSNNRSLNVFA